MGEIEAILKELANLLGYGKWSWDIVLGEGQGEDDGALHRQCWDEPDQHGGHNCQCRGEVREQEKCRPAKGGLPGES